MGNCAPMKPAGRLVHPDGKVEHFTRPMQVTQVMMQNPQYYVGPPAVQQSPKAILAGDEFIQPGQLYYLVPAYLIPPEMFRWQKNYDDGRSGQKSRSSKSKIHALKGLR
ncbi:hypothetical protein MPTK1_3g19240 [Marchantia polymorpha subsp. ruderalis]|uniref:Uncharacterized protein n=2 Tax=Marchantia polymorpha TaxID=3197 RepID=A0A176WIW8_MARPO|nr:hypothetical protein AXG93_2153s1050 [Marchantia polymorpha subsp. ruderalis]PTQ38835.1 hypothetical protein MARPO_0049s0110 [Marchantia polymorpha]BBN06208.1 hypothetical protein Mp_3g19240 [Marchantia polymorpha subsp. ruderalis]|eukprot:PTQ38835.1 hypothetical protein MARPO_0049s0110 [Marchantia polymorpha]